MQSIVVFAVSYTHLCIMANHGFTAVAAELETALAAALAAEKAAEKILTAEK